jgi:hypothetical protein
MIIALCVLGFVSFIFIGIATFYGTRSWVLVRRGQSVAAQVVDLQSTYDSEGGTTYKPIFQYEWNGQTMTSGAAFSSNPPRYQVGEAVMLYVDPANPSDVAANRFLDLWLMPLIFGGVAGILVVVSVVIVLVNFFVG